MGLGKWWRQRQARLLQLWAVGLLAACLVTGASAMGYLESLQARALDLLIYLQSPASPRVSSSWPSTTASASLSRSGWVRSRVCASDRICARARASRRSRLSVR